MCIRDRHGSREADLLLFNNSKTGGKLLACPHLPTIKVFIASFADADYIVLMMMMLKNMMMMMVCGGYSYL